MKPMPRYLTPDEKMREMATWETLIAKGTGAPGDPDFDMVPWCARLNAIAGICTLQSCAGHGTPSSVEWCGRVWLWLEEGLAKAFDRRAFQLARAEGIERVSREYSPWGQEIVAIEFAGNERGRLPESMGAIVAFCESVSRENATSHAA